MNINKLIDFHKYGTEYHGDVKRDTIDVLEAVREIVPYDDDLCHIIDILRDYDNYEEVEDVLDILKELQRDAQYVRSLIE